MMAGILILGAGHAGGTAAVLLRQNGYDGPITLVGDEPYLPYQRPPLSKGWLKGQVDADALLLKPASFYDEQGIELLAGYGATAIDRSTRRVTFADGSVRGYDSLILATGARAATLPVPGADLAGLHSLRSMADADRLRSALQPGRRLAVIGGGYIGLEVAASARSLGADVVVLERESRLLARVASPALSAFFQRRHEEQGVHFLLGSGVAGLIGDRAGHVAGIQLADGCTLPCDAVLVCIGARPNDGLAQAAGLDCPNGVRVDLSARTLDPAIYAIGDVTYRPLPLYGSASRLESVPSALEQAKQAAAAITGRPPPPAEVPWQWSDQYDVKLQIAGLPIGADQILVRGNPDAGRFATFHLQGDQVRAVEAVNRPSDFMLARQFIAAGRRVDVTRLADPAISVKEAAL